MNNGNMYLEIARVVAASPGDIAIEAADRKAISYADLDCEVGRYANALLALGLRRGDRVAVQAPKSLSSLYVYLACLRAGLVYLPLNTAYQSQELEYFLRDAEPKLLLVTSERAVTLQPIAASIDARLMTLGESTVNDLVANAAACAAGFETVKLQPQELAVIIYTSGTTGRSKGAMVTHDNLVSNVRALTRIWRFGPEDVLLHALPIFHVHGLFVANHCALTSGARMLWHDRFEPAAVMRDLPRSTVLMGVPTFYTRLLGEAGFDRDVCANMRLFISGSAPLLAETHREFETRTGHRILERYGMSEAGMITSNPCDGERRAGTVGFPLPDIQVRIVDAADQLLPTGEKGAIQVKGPNIFSGYWRMPERTREEFTADGWFRTGDVGMIDGDGYLSIVGRAKDLIITGGYNVYPKEVELLIDEMAGVTESAVVGVPHPDFGEAVTAVVVLQPDAKLNETEIIASLKTRIAAYKVPKRVHVVAELPRNAMGKVQKAELRKRYGSDWMPG